MGFSVIHRQNALSYYFQVSTPVSPGTAYVSLHDAGTGTTGANELPFVNGYFRNFRSGWQVVGTSRGEDVGPGSFGNNEGQTVITVRQFGLWNQQFGGDFIFGGDVDGAPVAWLPGEEINWAAGGLGLVIQGSRAAGDIRTNLIRWYLDLGPSRPANTYLSLHFGDPGTAGLNEYSAGGYARTGSISWQLGAGTFVTNSNTLTTGTADPDWGETGQITHFGIFDAQVGGNYIIGGPVAPNVSTPNPGAAFIAFAGDLAISAT